MKIMDVRSDGSEPTEKLQPVVAGCEVADLGIAPHQCVTPQPLDSCTIVIFGASGDLAARKLIPALFKLYRNGGLPKPFRIVGCARTKMDHAEFRAKLEERLVLDEPSVHSQWKDFALLLHYQSLDYEDITSFVELAGYLKKLDRKQKTGGNRIFYLAIPPMLYETVARHLGEAARSP